MFSRPEAFEFHISRAFGKEGVGVDRAIRLACKCVGVGDLGCGAVPNPAACQIRRVNFGFHALPFAASPGTSQSQSGLYQEGDQNIDDEAAQSPTSCQKETLYAQTTDDSSPSRAEVAEDERNGDVTTITS